MAVRPAAGILLADMAPPLRSILARRNVWTWCLYDWGNSAYSTCVIAVLLPIFYRSLFGETGEWTFGLFGRQWTTNATSMWMYSSGIYMLVAAAASPVLGAMADSIRGKRWFLAGFAALGIVFTAALGTVGPGEFLLCSLFYIVSGFGWTAANVFYEGFLPELAQRPEEMEPISIGGFAAGYLGGGSVLAINMAMVTWPGVFGLTVSSAARACFVVIAAWWAAFALPLLLTAREGGAGAAGRRAGLRHGEVPAGRDEAGRSLVGEGFARVAATLRKIRRLPHLGRFLLAFLFYHTGIGTMMVVAAIFATDDLHLGTGTIVGCLLMVQFVAMPAAFGFLALSRAIGSRNCIVLGIVVFVGVVLFATQMHFAWQFWVLGVMVALVTGGTQAISRSIFGSMIPPGLNAEFFGFFSVYSKVGSFAGPLVFGVCRDLTGSSRLSILFLAAFFVVGLAILLTVRVQRGVEEAAAFELPLGRT